MNKVENFFENTLAGQALFVVGAFAMTYGLFWLGYIFQ